MQGLTRLALCIGALVAAFDMHHSEAQTADEPAKSATRVITLGTVAGPPPRRHRAQSSNLLIVNGTLYVVDAGDGAARRVAKARFNVRDVGTIFITHHHDDHTAGIGTLMSTAWDNQRTTPIHVYCRRRAHHTDQPVVLRSRRWHRGNLQGYQCHGDCGRK
jgi:ribonuclease BN (tRNA processing enzyme)